MRTSTHIVCRHNQRPNRRYFRRFALGQAILGEPWIAVDPVRPSAVDGIR
jgi:hypothetical protein